jgi:hypothetical protein
MRSALLLALIVGISFLAHSMLAGDQSSLWAVCTVMKQTDQLSHGCSNNDSRYRP